MRLLMIVIVFGALLGCEATAIRSSSEITTVNKLNPEVSTPIAVPVAIYVDKSKPEQKHAINFFAKMEEAAQLVTDDLFQSSVKLTTSSDFQYMFYFSSINTWNQAWGIWNAEVNLKVLNHQGETLYTGTFKSSENGGLYDIDGVFNSLAEAAKEGIIAFLNNQSPDKINAAVSEFTSGPRDKFPIKTFIGEVPPTGSGTGFFIDNNGLILTAAHVVADCIHVELQHKGELMSAEVQTSSQLLDLAVVNSNFNNGTHVAISSDAKPVLGKQVFVTGYPLAGILSDYPSLTVGNISSIGGLKGSKGTFQFSAPVQPGNSGGAIVDYKGNVIGLVSSSLNQAMMLQQVGTVSQNVNFGIEPAVIRKFLQNQNVSFETKPRSDNFEKASADAVEYTVQVLCYK